jgi:hypothetical protein
MDYLPLFLLMAAVLIAAWFYLQRAKNRDAGASATVERHEARHEPAAAEPAHTESAVRPTERHEAPAGEPTDRPSV